MLSARPITWATVLQSIFDVMTHRVIICEAIGANSGDDSDKNKQRGSRSVQPRKAFTGFN